MRWSCHSRVTTTDALPDGRRVGVGTRRHISQSRRRRPVEMQRRRPQVLPHPARLDHQVRLARVAEDYHRRRGGVDQLDVLAIVKDLDRHARDSRADFRQRRALVARARRTNEPCAQAGLAGARTSVPTVAPYTARPLSREDFKSSITMPWTSGFLAGCFDPSESACRAVSLRLPLYPMGVYSWAQP